MRGYPTSISTFLMLLCFSSTMAAEPAGTVQTRCGWFDNPTPGNAWLNDADGQWIISTQGGHQADGDWPALDDSQRVFNNGVHGYGCACIKAVVNEKTHEVIHIRSAWAKPLNACRRDPALKEP